MREFGRLKKPISKDPCAKEDAAYLSLDPTQRFHVLQQEFVLGHLVGKLDAVVAATLRYPDDRLDLLDLLIVGRRDTV